MKKIAAILIIVIVMSVSLFGCSSDDGFMEEKEILQIDNPTGTITVSFTDDIQDIQTFTLNFELFYKKAPITVTNFVKLVKEGFYDDTFCHKGNTTPETAYLNVECYELDEEQKKVKKEIEYYIKGEFS